MLKLLDQSAHEPIIVAAAGNNGASPLDFPARFGNVIAVVSVDSNRALSDFSSWGEYDHNDDIHLNVFGAPGGQQRGRSPATEYSAQSTNGDPHFGTSFAAAYASGLIAHLWSLPAHSAKSRAQLLDYLRSKADTGFPQYSSQKHGIGLIRLQ
jgi:subtilisin family serine protease